ncbi:diaminopimelate epimerase [Candidatus Oleimmundimicrobium sp.]|uniref:diaminopimelate epimerase n=1 Tax=Candidatus Oleimmundimicrobium sp. TaxID=3060597 RepID=UPI002726E9D6|nr:diaminopimelate epimerase [Candidatus Oleimmundimicrobium sp.]MDO8885406.1 diaminopimelate epimerase [Candidatus Oleimmundimicrobium sp.]
MNKVLEFIKSQGAGNDFILISDLKKIIELNPEKIRWLCNRHFGIGADGVILVRPPMSSKAEFFMLFYNSDGTMAEMCGNGIRCFAKFLYDQCLITKDTVSIETPGGIKDVQLIFNNKEVAGAKVNMGNFSFKAIDIPINIEKKELIDEEIEVDSQKLKITCVSTGNPHCVIFVKNVSNVPIDIIGPKIENMKIFPNKTNVEFAQVVNKSEIKLRVWERGVGETLACGTGACATVVAANKLGLTQKRVSVHLLGGDLEIEIMNNDVSMIGPAKEIFTGKIYLNQEDCN